MKAMPLQPQAKRGFSVAVLEREKAAYKELLRDPSYDELYKWESLKNFHDRWDLGATDMHAMFDASFQNSENDNLWANQYFFPKSVMLRFIGHDPERVRSMFRELFDESLPVDKRIDHFVFHCDELLKQVNAADPSVKSHYHDGQRMVTLYLAFKYPEKYAIYKYTEFKTFMELVQASDIPRTGEYERFFKVVRTIYSILEKDTELMELHRSLLRPIDYQGKTLMIAQDFIFRTARRYMGS